MSPGFWLAAASGPVLQGWGMVFSVNLGNTRSLGDGVPGGNRQARRGGTGREDAVRGQDAPRWRRKAPPASTRGQAIAIDHRWPPRASSGNPGIWGWRRGCVAGRVQEGCDPASIRPADLEADGPGATLPAWLPTTRC